jgi:leucine dehydrogenase
MKIDISKNPEFDNHELVSWFEDSSLGLRGFIVVHNTNMGPAVGGTRYWIYKNENEAITDALRLSRSMTYKCALAGVPFGGGKGVIIADSKTVKTKQFLQSYAKKVSLLGGNFYTGEDVGLTLEDINCMASSSRFIIGSNNKAGDPSPWAALSVFYAMKAALYQIYKNCDFSSKKIAIKGLGKVGMELARLLYKEGAELFVSDIDKLKINEIKSWGDRINVASVKNIHKLNVDIYAPCAMGGDLTERKINELNCKIICGSANNQLERTENANILYKRNILYIPDYLANSGGLINVVAELETKGYSKDKVFTRVQKIEETTRKVLVMSLEMQCSPNEVVNKLAQDLFMKNN